MPAAKPQNPFAEKLAGTEVRRCPVCGKPAALSTRPFCSKRCADVDLHRWLGGRYAVPAAPDPDAEPDGAGER